MADSAFTFDPRRPNPNKNREAFYSLMIKLCQIAAGHINVRTTLWVEAFESWQRSGLG